MRPIKAALARISGDYAIMERALQTIADGFCSQVNASHLAMETLAKLQATVEDMPVTPKEDDGTGGCGFEPRQARQGR